MQGGFSANVGMRGSTSGGVKWQAKGSLVRSQWLALAIGGMDIYPASRQVVEKPERTTPLPSVRASLIFVLFDFL